jgi:hypothetical protein
MVPAGAVRMSRALVHDAVREEEGGSRKDRKEKEDRKEVVQRRRQSFSFYGCRWLYLRELKGLRPKQDIFAPFFLFAIFARTPFLSPFSPQPVRVSSHA